MSEPKTEPKFGTPAERRDATDYPHDIELIQPASIERQLAAYKIFQEFKQRILTKDDWVVIAGRQYLKKSAWRKWALGCGVSDEILSCERVPVQGRDQDGDFSYRVIVRAFHKPTERSSVGVAMASWSEKKDWAHKEHDIFTLSHTRAKNRAIADLVGGGEVSAEEVVASETSSERKTVEATKSSPASTLMPPVSPTGTWTPKVPVAKDPLAVEGVKQHPLIQGTQSIAMVNVLTDGSEASIVPERPVDVDAAPIQSFLISRVLDAMKAKHAGFDYRLQVDQDEMLQAILIHGKLDETEVKELSNAAKWAFQRALEKQAASA